MARIKKTPTKSLTPGPLVILAPSPHTQQDPEFIQEMRLRRQSRPRTISYSKQVNGVNVVLKRVETKEEVKERMNKK